MALNRFPYRDLKAFKCWRKGGFSLVEMMIVVLVGTFIVGGVYSVLLVGKNNWETNRDKIELEQNLRTAMEWLRKDIRQAGVSKITGVPSDGSSNSSISFQTPSGVTSGSVTWGTAISYSKGGVSNKQLLRTVGVTQKIIAQNISSVVFSRTSADPEIILITLQVQKNTPQHGIMTLSRTAKVKARN